MRLGLNTDGPIETVRLRAQIAEREEFDYLELNLGDQTIQKSYWLAHADDILNLLERHNLGLTVHLPKIDVLIGSPRDKLSKSSTSMLADYIEIAGKLGASKAILHPQYSEIDHPIRKKEARANLVQALEHLEGVATQEQVELLIENGIPDRAVGYEISLRDFTTLFGEVPVSYALNTSHAQITGMTSGEITDFLQSNEDNVSHMYLNDTRGTVDEHMPINAGTIDFREIFDCLSDMQWNRTATIELKVDDSEYISHSKRYIDNLDRSVNDR